MALFFMDGFEGGDTAVRWDSVSGNMQSNTTTRFSSGRSAWFGAGSNFMAKYFSGKSEIYLGFAAFNITNTGTQILILYSDAGLSAQLNIVANNTNGSISVRRGATVLLTSGAGVLSSGWNYIEMRAKVDPSAGVAELRVNNVVVGTFSGNTKNTGTSNNIDTVYFTNSAAINWYIDDVYVLDTTGSAPYNTYLGEMRIYGLVPSGAGTSTQLTPSSGANYTTVDELPYSATDYVSGGTVGLLDTYAITDLPATASSVLAVQTNIIGKRTDANPISLKPAIRSGGTVYYGSTTAFTANDHTFSDLRTTDPATSTAWTVSGVNGIEAGVELA